MVPPPPTAPRPRHGATAHARQAMVHDARGGRMTRRSQPLAIEEPLEIRLDTPSGLDTLTVTMRTPGNDIELVAGWLLGEGVIDAVEDVARINYCVDAASGGDQRFNVVTAVLRVPPRRTRVQRTPTSSTGGVCGNASIDALGEVGFPRLGAGPCFDIATVASLPEGLRAGHGTFEATGAGHGAALVDGSGQPIVVREDVGYHHAVDKVIGWALLERQLPLEQRALVVDGQVSFEIVQKAARAGAAMVVAVSGATSLAVSLAEAIGMTLIGFARGAGCTVYTGPNRVIDPASARRPDGGAG